MTIIDSLLALFVVPERERLRNLLVPELADLRQQLDQARRLASEAQGRFRRAEEIAISFMREGTLETWQSMQAERDQLREQLTLEVKNATRLAAEGDQLRARVAELEAERAKMIEGGSMAEPRPNLTADGQPITYVTPQPAPASDNQGALRYDDFKPTRYL